jgi:hypothetical protein
MFPIRSNKGSGFLRLAFATSCTFLGNIAIKPVLAELNNLSHRNAKGVGDFVNVFDRNVPAPLLHGTDVRTVETCELGEPLLGQASVFPHLPDGTP